MLAVLFKDIKLLIILKTLFSCDMLVFIKQSTIRNTIHLDAISINLSRVIFICILYVKANRLDRHSLF